MVIFKQPMNTVNINNRTISEDAIKDFVNKVTKDIMYGNKESECITAIQCDKCGIFYEEGTQHKCRKKV